MGGRKGIVPLHPQHFISLPLPTTVMVSDDILLILYLIKLKRICSKPEDRPYESYSEFIEPRKLTLDCQDNRDLRESHPRSPYSRPPQEGTSMEHPTYGSPTRMNNSDFGMHNVPGPFMWDGDYGANSLPPPVGLPPLAPFDEWVHFPGRHDGAISSVLDTFSHTDAYYRIWSSNTPSSIQFLSFPPGWGYDGSASSHACTRSTSSSTFLRSFISLWL